MPYLRPCNTLPTATSLLLIALLASTTRCATATEPAPVVFEADILPILAAHCFKCHGLEARKANLDLRTVGMMLRGGDNGAVLVKGSAKESSLYARIADRSMPPEKELPLTDDKIVLFRRWLDAGAQTASPDAPLSAAEAPDVTAEDRLFWAFRKPVRATLPSVQHVERMRTPIDAFVLAKLESRQLSYSAEADRPTLIRRATFDLLGLPPTPAQVAQFLADSDEGAYERLIDRLLASPHFGERWGRHWLDSSGYVDTIGDDTDAAIAKVSPGKWQYRDYVTGSFNGDKPFDRFLIEQMAGDELVDWQHAETFDDATRELLIATGMLRAAADETMQNELNTADIRQAVLERTMEVVANNVLGLTVNCARCHSHKFDPIPQKDYYRMLAVFSPAFNPQAWLQPAQRELPDISKPDKTRADAANAEIDKQVNGRKATLAAIKKPYEDRLREARLTTLPESIRADTQSALQTEAAKRSEVQKYLAGKFEALLKISAEEIAAAQTEADKSTATRLEQEIATLNSGRRSWGTIQAVYDVGPPPATYLLRRGNLDRPGPEVAPGFLQVLAKTDAQATIAGPPLHQHTSGRRLAFARWLTDVQTPAGGLVARVYVNRVWQYLFGQGIVGTSDNFGHSGDRPTHPELLDWLAIEFQAGGWHVKPLVRLIMTSAAYRQASHRERTSPGVDDGQSDPQLVDPANELLWRMRLRQMESECVRDAILIASGNLEVALGGPPTMIEGKPDGTVVVKKEGSSPRTAHRRSMYLLARRRYNLSLLEAFDQPELTSNCTRRTPSAVVSQSLAMLNDDFVKQQAAEFAARVRSLAGEENNRVIHAFRIALAREPVEAEVAWAAELLQRQTQRYQHMSMSPAVAADKALAHLCQALLNTNEFLYIR